MRIIIILITSIIISNHPVKESCGAERKLQSPSFPICHVPNESRRLSTESSYVQSMMLSRRLSTESSYVQSMMLSRRLSTESSYVQSMMLSSNTCVGIPDLLIHSTGMSSVNITLNQSMATRNVSEVNGWVSTNGLDDVGTYFDTGCLTFETVISNPFTNISIHVYHIINIIVG